MVFLQSQFEMRDIKPAIRFLVIFVSSYLLLSLVYGLWIESLGNQPDFMTRMVSEQVAAFVRILGYPALVQQNLAAPTVFILQGDSIVLNVFEGCNGLNVMIVFLSFVLAFGGASWQRIVLFISGGAIAIHMANLLRLLWLYGLSFVDMRLFHYFHKYLFTAFIYLLVFVLWWFWINHWNGYRPRGDHATK